MTMQAISSYGRLVHPVHDVTRPASGAELVAALGRRDGRWLAYGNGRSYGDVCFNAGGRLADMRGLDRFIEADWDRGIVRADAGMTLDALLRVSVPRGWFVRVTPGTKYVTLGGAVANDVHGKNHGAVGTFGRFVRRLGLVRSDRGELDIAPGAEPDCSPRPSAGSA